MIHRVRLVVLVVAQVVTGAEVFAVMAAKALVVNRQSAPLAEPRPLSDRRQIMVDRVVVEAPGVIMAAAAAQVGAVEGPTLSQRPVLDRAEVQQVVVVCIAAAAVVPPVAEVVLALAVAVVAVTRAAVAPHTHRLLQVEVALAFCGPPTRLAVACSHKASGPVRPIKAIRIMMASPEPAASAPKRAQMALW